MGFIRRWCLCLGQWKYMADMKQCRTDSYQNKVMWLCRLADWNLLRPLSISILGLESIFPTVSFFFFHSPFRPQSPFRLWAFSFFQGCGVHCLWFLDCLLGWEELLYLIFYHRLDSVEEISSWRRPRFSVNAGWMGGCMSRWRHAYRKTPKNKGWISMKGIIQSWTLCKGTSQCHWLTLHAGSNICDGKGVFLFGR